MNYARKAIISSLIIVTASILAQFFGYIARMFLARNLSTAQFGLFYSVMSSVLFIGGLFTDLGYSSALTKFISEFRAKGQFSHLKKSFLIVLSIKLFLSLLVSGIVFFLSGFLAKYYFKSPEAVFVVQIFALVLFFGALNNLLIPIFQGFQKMFMMSLVNFLQKFFFFLFVVLFFFIGFSKSVVIPTLAFALGILLPFILLFFPAFRLVRLKSVESVKVSKRFLFRKLSAFAFPSLLSGLAGFVIGYIDVIILTALVPLSDVGVYNSVLPTALILAYFGSALSSVMFPMVSELHAKNEVERLKKGVRKLYNYVLFGLLPLALVVFAFPDLILRILFGGAYTSGALSLQILVIGVVFLSIAQVNNSVLGGLGFPKSVMIITFIAAIFNASLNLVLIPFFGIPGAALTTCLSYLLMFLGSSFLISRKIGMKLPVLDWLKIVFAGGVFLGVVLFVKSFNLNFYLKIFLSLLLSALIYLIICLKLRIVSVKEVRGLIRN